MPSREEASDECRVLTLGSSSSNQNYSWRRIRTNCTHRPFVYGQCINGVLYYQAQLGGGSGSGRAIMRFDVRSEKLSVISLPWDGYWKMRITTYERRFACVGSIENSISMWVLEDAEKLKWSNHIFLPLSHYDQVLGVDFKLVGSNDESGVYVQTKLSKSFHVIYIHPKRKTFKKVEYSGIVDDDFRKHHGLGDGRLHELQVFPNHIETLLSY
ncbi:putative F-box protein [Raphanus sativus]|uniref:F-box protein At1g47730 n=1 Tax=Raphanus sativus TaxID=3726 RepID=A0A9W3DJS3_RAPSA|nr:putative F-box protein At1g47730 [Raphanus sativus]KAJ4901925.1 putative F-box protein [Raphanus sativus]